MNSPTRKIVFTAMMIALICVGGFIKIPIGFLDVTLQSLLAVLAGLLLGAKYGAIAQAIYLFMGLVGIPIFTQGGGITYVLKPSCGYLFGFILGAFVTGLLSSNKMGVGRKMLAAVIGTLSIYVIGVPYQFMIMGLYLNSSTSVMISALGQVPLYILGDFLCLILVAAFPIRYFRQKIGIVKALSCQAINHARPEEPTV